MIYSKEQARLNLISAVRLIDKYFALKYDPDQPRDEAGRWTDGGGGGKVSNNTDFNEVNEGIYRLMGVRAASDTDIVTFKSNIDKLPSEIQDLKQGEYTPLIVAVKDDESYYGISQSNWIVIGSESNDDIIANHEFIHYIVQGGTIGENLDSYKPTWYFDNSKRENYTIRDKKNEDLTMALDCFNSNNESWIDNIMRAESGISKEDAEYKIKYTTKFLKDLGLW